MDWTIHARRLMRCRAARFSRLRERHYADLCRVADAVAWIGHTHGLDLAATVRVFRRWVLDQEYGFGLRRRRHNYTQRGTVPPGPCYRHADRPGVYLIDGQRHCRACGVTRRRLAL